MHKIKNIRENNIDLIHVFIKLMRSNPTIIINDELYASIKRKIQMLINEM
jgi:hypothetical protein